MGATLRSLSLAADPSDRPRFATSAIYGAAQEAAHLQGGRVAWQRVQKATQSALEDALAEGPWSVFHFAGHAECRVALNYTRLALESSSGQARELDGSSFTQVLSAAGMPETIVLQACNQGSFCFDLLAEELVKKGALAVVQLCSLSGEATRAVFAALYKILLEGRALSSLGPELRVAHLESAGVKVSFRADGRIMHRSAVPVTPTAPAPEQAQHPVREVPRPKPEIAARIELRNKRQAGQFDVFLCHNSADKPAVTDVARRLMEQAVLPWLDEFELEPGADWQVALERWITVVRSAAVFIGNDGLGLWQRQELNALMDEGVSRRVSIIPVVLPNVVGEPKIPVFLRQKTWIDFRKPHPDPFLQLLWGITKQRPED